MMMVSRGIVFLLIVGNLGGAGASNLRSQEQVNKTKGSSDGPDEIADPTCKQGIVSPDLKACCASGCGHCGNHKLCGDIGKYHEATGKLADQCCKDRILKKAPSCDKDHPPCVLSSSYKENLNSYVIDRPKRHALDDCNKAVSISRSKNALGIEKGDFFTKLAIEGTTKYQDAKAMAIKVRGLCEAKTRQSKELVDRYSQKVSSANAEDKKKDALSGVSQVMQWEDKRDNEKSEVKFYNMIITNSNDVEKAAKEGIGNVKSLKAEVQPFKVKDLSEFHVKLNALTDDANLVHKDAELLWKQWKDASKDYSCGEPPAVGRVKSQCDKGNTKFSPKCAITCLAGYDGKGTQNALRCNRQGKFGKQLYGEWQGMASCMGRNCGKPPKISKAKTVIQDVIYPHAAAYGCYEGFSTNRKPDGPKAFSVSCDATGGFAQNSNQCKAITCGRAPALKNADVSAEPFFYTQVATYKCQEGHTVDETAGGLKSFQVSCLATGMFTASLKCLPVRCGPSPDFANTELLSSTKSDRFFGDKLDYKCEAGYTINQKPKGPATFTLVCPADGEFAVPGASGDSPLPKCRPMSAGVAPQVKHGKFNPREMFYGESALITANSGYSVSGNPNKGTSFTLDVTTLGQYSGREIFVPVVCGPTPSVDQGTTDFKGAKVVYGDVLSYECKDGYSTDKTKEKAAASFSIQCESDASLSQIPGYGTCANIDDCDGITCGAKGTCVDHLKNYTCSCESGYEQRMDNKTNELTCGNIDNCGPEACGIGECIDGLNDYKCTCPTGYEQVDSDDGKDHTCQAVSCGTPPEIDSAETSPIELQVQKADYQNKVVYQCDEGHTIDAKASGKNHFDIECLATKSFTAAKTCKPIKCNNVPTVKNGKATKTKAVFNESVRFDCQNGYTVDGSATGDRGFTVACQVSGDFGEPQECKPVTCGEPDNVAFAFRASGTMVYKNSVTYTCFKGYTLSGDRDAKTSWKLDCKSDGKFTKMKQCLPKICGKPHLKIHVLYSSTKDEGVIRYPMNTEVLCRDGYTVGGDVAGASTFNVRCTSEGVFEKSDKRNCDPVRCGPPPAMANATLSKIHPEQPKITAGPLKTNHDARCLDYNYNNKNVYMHGCHDGKNQQWYLDDAGRLKTKHDGNCLDYNYNDKNVYMHGCHGGKNQQWYFDDAGRLKTKHDGNCLDYNYNDKNVYMHGCHDGKNQQWLINGKSAFYIKGGSINYEEKAVYKCNTGFTTGGEYNAPTNFNVECLPSGQLSAPTPENQCRNVNDCEQHTCGKKGQCVDLIGPAPAYTCKCDHGYEIQTASNGEKTCGNKDDCEGRGCGVGTCKDLVGDYTCICPSGHYIGVKDGQKTCVPVQCESSTPILSHGRLLSSHSGAVNFPTTLRYKCATGYSVDGTVSESMRKFQAQCKPHGELVGMSACQKISCGSAHVVPFTTLLLPSSQRRSIEYDDKAKYKCITGYTVGGTVGASVTFEVKCQDSGSLTDPKVCEPVKCGSPPSMPKSRPSIAGNAFYGQNLVYSCDVGFSLDGTPRGSTQFQRHCKIDGSFSSTSETCKPMSAGPAPTIRHAKMSEYAGRAVTTFPPQVYYPNGLEYRCNAGYSTTGSSTAPTKITSRVNSIGTFSPALATACKLIVFQMRSKIKSARSGAALNGVTVRIDGTSNTATTQNGFFTMRNLRAGNVNVVYERSGYITVRKALSITGNINSGGIGDVSMSPAMRNDEWRAVLKWGASPRDPDSYAMWGSNKVYYGNKRAGGGGNHPMAVLEQDITSGFGPETVYFSNLGKCEMSTPTGPLTTNHDARCLDYNYGNQNVYMHQCHNGNNQQWYFDTAGRLKTKGASYCLDYNYNTKNVYMHQCHDGKNQEWYFDSAGRLKTKHDDLCLDYNYNNKNVYMHPCHEVKSHAPKPLGGANNANAANLEACIGECDNDSQCKSGLKCFQRSGLTPVPGCTGSGKKDWDYCYDPAGSIALSGGNNNNANNLGACSGECDNDAQCASGLKCFQRSNGETIPGCSGPGAGRSWDYCYNPTPSDGKNQQWKLTDKTNQDVCDIQYKIKNIGASVDAEVTLFTGLRTAGTWKITDCPRSVSSGGSWWHVFTLDAKTNKVKWGCSGAVLLQTTELNHTIAAHSTNQTMPVPEKQKLPRNIRR